MHKAIFLALGLSAGLVWSAGCGGDAFETLDSTTPGGADGGSSGQGAGGVGGATAGASGNPAGQGGSTGGQGGASAAGGNGQSGNGQSGTSPGGAGGTPGGGSSQAGSGQAGSGTAGQGDAGSAGSGTAGSGTAGSGEAGQGQAGSGTAGSGEAGQGQAGSGTAGGGQAGSGQAGSGQSGSGQAGGATAGQGGAMGCSFPDLGKACDNDASCSFGLHEISCCGSVVALGFNHAFKTDFEAAEPAWESCLLACGCAGDAPKAEDGKYLSEGTVAVACTNNQCTTYVKTANACDAPFPTFDPSCGSDLDCIVGYHQVDCCGSLAAVGVNVADNDAFSKAENAWLVCHPVACDCLPKPITTDDGATTDINNISWSCDNGSCRTKVK